MYRILFLFFLGVITLGKAQMSSEGVAGLYLETSFASFAEAEEQEQIYYPLGYVYLFLFYFVFGCFFVFNKKTNLLYSGLLGLASFILTAFAVVFGEMYFIPIGFLIGISAVLFSAIGRKSWVVFFILFSITQYTIYIVARENIFFLASFTGAIVGFFGARLFKEKIPVSVLEEQV